MLLTIDRYLNPIEAHIVRGRIEAEGVPAYVQHEHHIWAKWTISLALGYVKVQVNAEDLEASCAIIEKLQAGEYALADEDEPNVSVCAKCGSSGLENVNWSWKLAILAVMFFLLVIPYTIYRVKCVECGHSWTQKELREYPLWISAFSILSIAAGFIVLERTFYYVCKINYWSDVCI